MRVKVLDVNLRRERMAEVLRHGSVNFALEALPAELLRETLLPVDP